MRDYGEQVKILRACASENGGCQKCPRLNTKGFANDCAMSAVREAADAIEELVAAVPKWISVEERLPDYEESVFVVRKFLGVKGQVPPSTYVEIAYRLGDRWVADSDEYKIARHRHTDPLYWMPLPDPPKEVE